MDDEKISFMLTKRLLYLSFNNLIKYFWSALIPLIASIIGIFLYYPNTGNQSMLGLYTWVILAFIGFLIVFLARLSDLRFSYLHTGLSMVDTYNIILPILQSKCVDLHNVQIDFVSGITDHSKHGERISILIQDDFVLLNSISEKGKTLIHYGQNKETIQELTERIKKNIAKEN